MAETDTENTTIDITLKAQTVTDEKSASSVETNQPVSATREDGVGADSDKMNRKTDLGTEAVAETQVDCDESEGMFCRMLETLTIFNS